MNYFREKDLSHLVTSDCSRETVRKILSLVDSESLNSLYTEMISALIKNDFRVVEAEVQAARSTGRTKLDSDSMHGALILMNSDDAIRRVCLCHKLIGKKGTVIPADPDILKKLNPDNAVVLANAMNCRYDFVSTVIGRGAHYCLSLKGNQNRTQDEIRNLFNTTRQDHIITSHPWAERTPGRTDYRVSIIRGSLLSDIILDRWQGLK